MNQMLFLPNPDTVMWIPPTEGARDGVCQPPDWVARNFIVPPGVRWQISVHGELVVMRPDRPLEARCLERKDILTPQQTHILKLLAKGYTPSQIMDMNETEIASEVKEASDQGITEDSPIAAIYES